MEPEPRQQSRWLVVCGGRGSHQAFKTRDDFVLECSPNFHFSSRSRYLFDTEGQALKAARQILQGELDDARELLTLAKDPALQLRATPDALKEWRKALCQQARTLEEGLRLCSSDSAG